VHDCEQLEQKRVQELIRQTTEQNAEDNNNQFENEEKEADKNEMEYLNPNSYSLQPLWGYRCELTRGRQVMYTTWNKQNEDIIAVAYGESRYAPRASLGLIL
jgi:dynein intermediate chain 4, axonemal